MLNSVTKETRIWTYRIRKTLFCCGFNNNPAGIRRHYCSSGYILNRYHHCLPVIIDALSTKKTINWSTRENRFLSIDASPFYLFIFSFHILVFSTIFSSAKHGKYKNYSAKSSSVSGKSYPSVTRTMSISCLETVSASGIRSPTYAFPP